MMLSRVVEAMSDQFSTDEATELALFIDNDEPLHRRKKEFLKNVARKIISGTYDEKKSVALWMYWVEEGAKKYAREFGNTAFKSEWHTMFPASVRREVAAEVAAREAQMIKNGEYGDIYALAERKPPKASAGKRKGNPVEGKFPWMAVGGVAAALGVAYWLFKPKAAEAAPAALPPAPVEPPSPPSPGQPPVGPVPPVPTGGTEVVLPGGLIPVGTHIAAWGSYQGRNMSRWEAGPIMDAYIALFPESIPAGGVGVTPDFMGSGICSIANIVPFSTMNKDAYRAVVFFMNPTDVVVDGAGIRQPDEVLSATVNCAQAISSMLWQRGIRAVFVLADTDDLSNTLQAGVSPVGGSTVRVPRSGVSADAVYEAGARAVHQHLYGV